MADKWVVTAAHCFFMQHELSDGDECQPGFHQNTCDGVMCCQRYLRKLEDDMSVIIGEHDLHKRNGSIRYKLDLSELFPLFFKESSGD